MQSNNLKLPPYLHAYCFIVNLHVEVLWAVMPCGIVVGYQRFVRPEDGGSMDLRNVGVFPQHHTMLQPRRPRPELLPPWKPEI
jgi:hypothetical protein